MRVKRIQNGDVTWGNYDSNSDYTFYLPHQCDEWVIGGIEEVEALIENLQKTAKQVRESHPDLVDADEEKHTVKLKTKE